MVTCERLQWVKAVSRYRSFINTKRAAAIMSLIQAARMNGHDQHTYLKDVLTRLPKQLGNEIGQLLPHQVLLSLRA